MGVRRHFSARGDTARSTFDRYTCAPDTDESGPEVGYRLGVREAGCLAIEVESRKSVRPLKERRPSRRMGVVNGIRTTRAKARS